MPKHGLTIKTNNMERINLDNPVWIFGDDINSYRFNFEIETDKKTFSVIPSVLCVYPERLELIDGLPEELNCTPYQLEGQTIHPSDDIAEDLVEGIKLLNIICSIKDTEYSSEAIDELQDNISFAQELINDHNNKFIEHVKSLDIQNALYEYINNLSTIDIIKLWNKQFSLETTHVPGEIYKNIPDTYESLCKNESNIEHGYVRHYYNKYDLYVIRHESLNCIPYVTTFSDIHQIDLKYKLREVITHQPFLYPDIIIKLMNDIKETNKEQLKYYKDVPEKYKKSLTDSADNFIKVFNDYTNDTNNNKLVKDTLKERKINL